MRFRACWVRTSPASLHHAARQPLCSLSQAGLVPLLAASRGPCNPGWLRRMGRIAPTHPSPAPQVTRTPNCACLPQVCVQELEDEAQVVAEVEVPEEAHDVPPVLLVLRCAQPARAFSRHSASLLISHCSALSSSSQSQTEVCCIGCLLGPLAASHWLQIASDSFFSLLQDPWRLVEWELQS